MEKEDDEKTEAVTQETFWATVQMTGGLMIWALLLISYFGLNVFSKYTELETKNIFADIDKPGFSLWNSFMKFFMFG